MSELLQMMEGQVTSQADMELSFGVDEEVGVDDDRTVTKKDMVVVEYS